jgi:hypothetical protein
MVKQASDESLQGQSWVNPYTDKKVPLKIKDKEYSLYKVGEIYFPTAKFELDEDDRSKIKSLADEYKLMLIQSEKLQFYFVGLADYRGSTSTNLELSKSRALSVADVFKNHEQFRTSQNWEPKIVARGESESPQEGDYYKGICIRRGPSYNVLNLLREFRRVDIYTNVPLPKPPTKGELIITVINASTLDFISGATVEIARTDKKDQSLSRRTTTDGQGSFENLEAGSYDIKVFKEEPKGDEIISFKHETTNEVKGGQTTMLKVKVMPMKRLPVQWIEKVTEVHADMGIRPGKVFTAKTIRRIHEEYGMVPEDHTEVWRDCKEIERKEIGFGDVYYIRRCQVSYGIKTMGEKAQGILLEVARARYGKGAGSEVVTTYNTWEEYPREDEPLQKYRPKN